MTEVLKVFSVCSGVEGLGQPLIDSELFKLIGFSEVDKHCNAVLRYLHPEVKNYGDITKLIKSRKLPDFDILIGGTPCQNLSMAGNREGLNGDKSRLFFDFIKILKDKKPRYFIWENVEGTLTSQGGWDFARVQVEMADAGYSFRWEVLSAVEFGIPQIRTRVFIVGVLRGKGSRKVFCEPRNSSYDGTQTSVKDEDQKICIRDEDEIKVRTRFTCLVANYHKGIDNHRMRSFIAYSKSTRAEHVDHRMRVNDAANTLNTGEGCSSQSTSNFILEPDSRLRRLMPIECERIMGWDDNRTEFGIDEKGKKYKISNTARYTMCGNGVVSACVEPIRNLILRNELRLRKLNKKAK